MRNKKLNGYSFNKTVVERLKTFDEFYAVYKPSAYADRDEATQKKMLQEVWDLHKPKTEKKG